MESYIFTQVDLKFVQNLLPNEVKVFLRDDNTVMDTCYNNTNKYVENATFNFSFEFFEEIQKHFSKIGKVTFNNTGTCWWISY